jgi:hypothetical protein
MHKSGSISEWLSIYQLPIGAIGFCIAQMLIILRRLGNQEAIELAEKADKKHDVAAQLKYDWEQLKEQDPVASEGTREVDDRIDRTLSLIHQGAEVYTGLEGSSRKKQLADEFVDELFPSGVFPITSMSFTEQHDAVVTLTDRLNGEFSEHVDELELRPLVDQLENLNDEFGDLLEADADRVVYDEVEAAYKEAEEAFHRLIVQVMGDYADDMETFNEVMAPVHKQTELMRRHLQRRGSAPPIDPETGEPVEPNDEGDTPVNDGGSPEESDGESSGQSDSESSGQSDGESSGNGENN